MAAIDDLDHQQAVDSVLNSSSGSERLQGIIGQLPRDAAAARAPDRVQLLKASAAYPALWHNVLAIDRHNTRLAKASKKDFWWTYCGCAILILVLATLVVALDPALATRSPHDPLLTSSTGAAIGVGALLLVLWAVALQWETRSHTRQVDSSRNLDGCTASIESGKDLTRRGTTAADPPSTLTAADRLALANAQPLEQTSADDGSIPQSLEILMQAAKDIRSHVYSVKERRALATLQDYYTTVLVMLHHGHVLRERRNSILFTRFVGLLSANTAIWATAIGMMASHAYGDHPDDGWTILVIAFVCVFTMATVVIYVATSYMLCIEYRHNVSRLANMDLVFNVLSELVRRACT